MIAIQNQNLGFLKNESILLRNARGWVAGLWSCDRAGLSRRGKIIVLGCFVPLPVRFNLVPRARNCGIQRVNRVIKTAILDEMSKILQYFAGYDSFIHLFQDVYV